MRSLQENKRYQWNILCRDRNNKGQKRQGPKIVEEIKKRWQEYTEEIYKKGLSDLDNHDGVVPHLEPDIRECEDKVGLRKLYYKQS